MYNLYSGLRQLHSDNGFAVVASRLPYRPITRQAPLLDPPFILRADELASDVSILSAMEILIESIALQNLDYLRTDIQRNLFSIERLSRIVPKEQAVGPILFDIADDKLIMLEQPAHPSPLDAAGVKQARDHLISSGESLIKQLEERNYDRRLIQHLAGLQQHLVNQTDIVALGMQNMTCQAVSSSLTHEIADALNGMLQAHHLQISMFVAQFAEWQKFSENAAQAAISVEGVSTLLAASAELSNKLRIVPQYVDQRIPEALDSFHQLASSRGSSNGRVPLALFRTLENLMIKTLNYGSERPGLFDITLKPGLEEFSKIIGKGLGSVLIIMVMGYAFSLATVSATVPGSAWVGQALAELSKKIGSIE